MGVRQQTPPHDLLSHKLLIGEGRRLKSKNQAHISQQNSDFHTFLFQRLGKGRSLLSHLNPLFVDTIQ